MRDVAALAGVGVKTVSRVVNGETGVSPELHARVVEAIDRLDYQRDLHASMLRRSARKTATIGLLLEDVANPFSSALERAIEDAASVRGVMVLAASCDEDPERERRLVATMRERRVDGIVLVPAGGADHGYLDADRRANRSVVFVDRPPRFLDADVVVSDNYSGARAAVAHLLEHGHVRIGYLGDDAAIHTAAERFRGYRDALAARGLAPDLTIERSGLRSIAEAERAVIELLSSSTAPTALFASQNLVTIGALHGLRALGAQDSVALVGFDDFPLADLLEPGVTVVVQDAIALGRAAADLLFRRLDGDNSPWRRVVIPVGLVARGSGELPPPDGDGRRRS
jgi:LacI family transcriptional regulator, galactose operon repressor